MGKKIDIVMGKGAIWIAEVVFYGEAEGRVGINSYS